MLNYVISTNEKLFKKIIDLFRNPVNKRKLKIKFSKHFSIDKSWGRCVN